MGLVVVRGGVAWRAPLLLVNCVLYGVGACLAGWGFNQNINSHNAIGENLVGDYVTTWFLPAALLSCVVGLASVLAGVSHAAALSSNSLAVATTISLLAWLLDLLAMGFAAKEIDVSGGLRPRRLKILEVFVIVVAILELLNLWSLHNNTALAGVIGVESGLDHQHQWSPTNVLLARAGMLHGVGAAAAAAGGGSHASTNRSHHHHHHLPAAGGGGGDGGGQQLLHLHPNGHIYAHGHSPPPLSPC
ncbi:membrane protein PM19L isoform X1 [Physcomitrium patens]|uniref:membrane protein PM19L isoform X1 n=1 Tax=Physcomitrium patens TaxID=3218 RepID=UPI000D15D4B4|nr:membrane protein PM19L-like [Physcomitrium patens]|eukprot:XP_024380235.1 membrane protein PM19L-like [Physcomitrella patens]